jgi:hypothetical protein
VPILMAGWGSAAVIWSCQLINILCISVHASATFDYMCMPSLFGSTLLQAWWHHCPLCCAPQAAMRSQYPLLLFSLNECSASVQGLQA